jgi:hypothetical protein
MSILSPLTSRNAVQLALEPTARVLILAAPRLSADVGPTGWNTGVILVPQHCRGEPLRRSHARS